MFPLQQNRPSWDFSQSAIYFIKTSTYVHSTVFVEWNEWRGNLFFFWHHRDFVQDKKHRSTLFTPENDFIPLEWWRVVSCTRATEKHSNFSFLSFFFQKSGMATWRASWASSSFCHATNSSSSNNSSITNPWWSSASRPAAQHRPPAVSKHKRCSPGGLCCISATCVGLDLIWDRGCTEDIEGRWCHWLELGD